MYPRLVTPTLLALATLAPSAYAESFAPTIVVPANDPGLTGTTPAQLGYDYTFSLDADVFAYGMYAYAPPEGEGYGSLIPFADHEPQSSIAIIGATGPGKWQVGLEDYSESLHWFDLPDVGADHALLLALVNGGSGYTYLAFDNGFVAYGTTQLRFMPDLGFSSTDPEAQRAQLTFRASDAFQTVMVDATNVGGATQFSASTLTLEVDVTPQNDAPTLDGSSHATVNPTWVNGQAGHDGVITGQQILDDIDAADADGDTLGVWLSVPYSSSVLSSPGYTIQYLHGGDAPVVLNDFAGLDFSVFMAADDRLVFTPNTSPQGDGGITLDWDVYAWDGTDGTTAPGFTFDASGTGFGEGSGSTSYNSAQLQVSLTENPAPTWDAFSRVVVYNVAASGPVTTGTLTVSAQDDVAMGTITGYDGESVLSDALPASDGSVPLWGEGIVSGNSLSRTLSFTVADPTVAGTAGWLTLAAIDAEGHSNQNSDNQTIEVYGNSQPIWPVESLNDAGNEFIGQHQTLSVDFTVNDVDAENADSLTWKDSLSLVGQDGDGNLTITTDHGTAVAHVDYTYSGGQAGGGEIFALDATYSYFVHVDYTPASTWIGYDSFSIPVVDANGFASDPLAVSVYVQDENDAPVNTVPPSLTGLVNGEVRVGTDLNVDIGSWNDDLDYNGYYGFFQGNPAFSYQWELTYDDPKLGSPEIQYPEVSGSTFPPLAEQAGAYVRVLVTADDELDAGNDTTVVYSKWYGPILPADIKHFAPIFVVDSTDPNLNEGEAFASQAASPSSIYLDDALFSAGIQGYVYDIESGYGTYQPLSDVGGTTGIALVDATGPGTWQVGFSAGEGTQWFDLGFVADYQARTLALENDGSTSYLFAGESVTPQAGPTKLRFVPDSSQTTPAQATLTFRGQDLFVSDLAYLYEYGIGGSGYFSDATRTLTIDVTPQNDAPQVIPESTVTVDATFVSGASGHADAITAKQILDTAGASDADNGDDSDYGLGVWLSISYMTTVFNDFTVEYVPDGGAAVTLNDYQGTGFSVFVAADDQLLFTPKSSLQSVQTVAIDWTIRAWDGSDGNVPGYSSSANGAGYGGGTGSASYDTIALQINLTENPAPMFTVGEGDPPWVVVYNVGSDTTNSVTLTAQDDVAVQTITGFDGEVAGDSVTSTDGSTPSWAAPEVSGGELSRTVSFTVSDPTVAGSLGYLEAVPVDVDGYQGWDRQIEIYGNSQPTWPTVSSDAAADDLSVGQHDSDTEFDLDIHDPDAEQAWYLSWQDSLSLVGDADITTDHGIASLEVQSDVDAETHVYSYRLHITYTPDGTFVGDDTFSVSVVDANGFESAALPVTIHVQDANDAPVNTTLPFLTGLLNGSGGPETEVRQDATLTVNDGVWNDDLDVGGSFYVANPTFSYQWQTTDADPQLSEYVVSYPEVFGNTFTPDLTSLGLWVRVKVTADDGLDAGNDTTSAYSPWYGPIVPPNSAPVIAEGATLTLPAQNEGPGPFIYSAALTISDDGPLSELTFDVTSGTGNLSVSSFDDETGVAELTYFQKDAHANGNEDFLITVTDAHGDSSSITVTVQITPVNDPPVIAQGSLLETVVLDEDSTPTAFSAELDASDADGDALVWTVLTAPAHGTATTGEGVGTQIFPTYVPDADFAGSDSFTIEVSDGNGGLADIIIPVTVTAQNDAPVITGTPLTTIAADSSYSFVPTASDIDGDTLTYSIANKPAWASFDTSTGVLSGTPGNANVGSTTGIVITVSDGEQSVSLDPFDVAVTHTNHVPTITGTPIVSIAADAAYSFTPTTVDADGDALTFSIANKPAWATFDTASGKLSGTPGNTDVGTTTGVVITVSDGTLNASLAAFNVAVTHTNHVPAISGTPGVTAVADAAYSFTPTALDADGDALTFSIVNKPAWATFNAATGTLSGTPANGDVGTTTGIVITVSDGTLSASLASFDLAVTHTDHAPTITGTPLVSIAADAAYSFTPTTNDVDGDTLSFSIVNRPLWATFDTTSGTLSGTPSNADVGSTTGVVIMVSDGALSASLAAFNVAVTHTNHVPAISGTPDVTAAADVAYGFTPTALDADNDALTFSIANKPAWATFDPTTGALSGTPSNADVGSTTGVVITVSDGALSASLASFDLAVTPANRAPVITEGTTLAVASDEDNAPTAFTGTLNVTDADGDTPAWSVTSLASHGMADVTSTGLVATLSYTPDADFNGIDTFTVTADDGHGGTDSTVVTVTVSPINDAPVATVLPSVTGSASVGGTLTLDSGVWNDLKDGGTSAITITQRWVAADDAQGNNATSIQGATGLTYVLTPAEIGKFIKAEVTVSDDGVGTPASASTVFFTPLTTAVSPEPNEAPVITEGATLPVTMDEDGSPLAFAATLHATDVDSSTFAWSISQAAAHGTATVDATGGTVALGYTPVADFNGTDSFRVLVDDGEGGTASCLVTVTVNPINDQPVNTVLPSLSGSPAVGGVLSAATGAWNDDRDGGGTLTYSYAWFSATDAQGNGKTQLVGETGATLVVPLSVAGGFVAVEVTAQDAGTGLPASQQDTKRSAWLAISTAGTLGFTTTALALSEGAGTVTGSPAGTLSVHLSAASTVAVSVPLIISGTADGSDAQVTPGTLTFAPGTTDATVSIAVAVDGPDGAGGTVRDETVIVTLGTPTGAYLGVNSQATVTIADQEPLAATTTIGSGQAQNAPVGTPIPVSLLVGQAVTVDLANGLPPYSVVSAAAGLTFFTYAPDTTTGQPGDTDLGPKQRALVLATSPVSNASIRLKDANGIEVDLVVTAVAPPVVTLPAPPVTVSTAETTVYGAISAGTPAGLDRLRALLAGRGPSEARAFWWDAFGQHYREIGIDDESTLQSTDGIFLASRSALIIDPSGVPSGYYREFPLQPGYNLIAVPPMSDGTTVETSHPLSAFVLFDAASTQVTGVERSNLIGSSAFYWDGTQYVPTTTLLSGRAYWIYNASSPAQTLSLVRFPNGADTGVTGKSVASPAVSLVHGRFAQTGETRAAVAAGDPGAVPAAPGSHAAASASSDGSGGGSCGSGAGVVLLGLVGFGLLRRRRGE